MTDVKPPDPGRTNPTVIRPLPLPDGTTVWTRPMGPDDAAAIQRLYSRLSPDTIYPRFFMASPQLSPELATYLTQIDGNNRRALAALDPQAPDEIIGVARYDRAPDTDRAEFAIAIEDRWQGHGLGSRLLRRLIEDAQARGIGYLEGDILPDNRRMLKLLRRLGLPWRSIPGDFALHIELDLRERDADPGGFPLEHHSGAE